MKIIAVDQARRGAWSVFDYEEKKLLDYGVWSFPSEKCTFEQAVLQIETLLDGVIRKHGVDAVFLEDIQLRRNVQSFKKLAQLQGVLVNLCKKNEYLYGLVPPAQWQSFCKARGRTNKEIKAKVTEIEGVKKTSKILSIQAARNIYGVETDDDNLADSIMLGHYCVNQIKIISKGINEAETETGGSHYE